MARKSYVIDGKTIGHWLIDNDMTLNQLAEEAYLLGQIIRYCDRAGLKDEVSTDLGKTNNYAHRLVYGEWRDA